MKTIVLGYRHSKGTYEGREYDNLNLHTYEEMERSTVKDSEQAGYMGIEYPMKKELLEIIQQVDFSKGPVELDIDMKMIAVRGSARPTVVGIKLNNQTNNKP